MQKYLICSHFYHLQRWLSTRSHPIDATWTCFSNVSAVLWSCVAFWVISQSSVSTWLQCAQLNCSAWLKLSLNTLSTTCPVHHVQTLVLITGSKDCFHRNGDLNCGSQPAWNLGFQEIGLILQTILKVVFQQQPLCIHVAAAAAPHSWT